MTRTCFLCDKRFDEIQEAVCQFCMQRMIESAKTVQTNLHDGTAANDDSGCDEEDENSGTSDKQHLQTDTDSDKRDNLANKRNALYRAFAWVAGT